MKRFTETKKWQDPWFRSLEPRLKCLWLYLCDSCDSAGVIEPDWDLASFVIGDKVSAADLPKFNGRIEQIRDGVYWITKFVAFQNKILSRHSPPQRAILDLLDRHGLLNRVNGCKSTFQP